MKLLICQFFLFVSVVISIHSKEQDAVLEPPYSFYRRFYLNPVAQGDMGCDCDLKNIMDQICLMDESNTDGKYQIYCKMTEKFEKYNASGQSGDKFQICKCCEKKLPFYNKIYSLARSNQMNELREVEVEDSENNSLRIIANSSRNGIYVYDKSDGDEATKYVVGFLNHRIACFDADFSDITEEMIGKDYGTVISPIKESVIRNNEPKIMELVSDDDNIKPQVVLTCPFTLVVFDTLGKPVKEAIEYVKNRYGHLLEPRNTKGRRRWIPYVPGFGSYSLFPGQPRSPSNVPSRVTSQPRSSVYPSPPPKLGTPHNPVYPSPTLGTPHNPVYPSQTKPQGYPGQSRSILIHPQPTSVNYSPPYNVTHSTQYHTHHREYPYYNYYSDGTPKYHVSHHYSNTHSTIPPSEGTPMGIVVVTIVILAAFILILCVVKYHNTFTGTVSY